MPDFARSDDGVVQAVLDRLWALSPGADVLGLDRITRLLARLGDPHRHLPPVFHVAGTNGKGSTCAFLRTALEAAGCRCHVYTSPHLVRFNERIRIAGQLIDDAALARLLTEVLDAGGDIGASFFEVTTAAAFLAFARTPADACVVEVGLGGRLDATNVVHPLVTGIAQFGVDHQAFLGDTIEAIAAEKAGIAKPGVPLVTIAYPAAVADIIAAVARQAGAPRFVADTDWWIEEDTAGLRYRDQRRDVVVPHPALGGRHQRANLGLAIAMLCRQDRLQIPPAALTAAARDTRWPARMQQLAAGPLTARLPASSRVWLDGAHNPAAAAEAAHAFRDASRAPRVLIAGLLANKDPAVIATLAADVQSAILVPVPDHASHPPDMLAATSAVPAMTAGDIVAAFDLLRRENRACDILIAGSLYLAGEVLRANDEIPT